MTTIFLAVDYVGTGPAFMTYFEGMPDAGRMTVSPDHDTAMSCHQNFLIQAKLYEAGITE